MTQEDFDDVSSRVYISALERGLKQPTLPKVDALAARMGVHPLVLLTLAYCRKANADDAMELRKRLDNEIAELVKKRQADENGDPLRGGMREAPRGRKRV